MIAIHGFIYILAFIQITRVTNAHILMLVAHIVAHFVEPTHI
jgi:hypothetical protein